MSDSAFSRAPGLIQLLTRRRMREIEQSGLHCIVSFFFRSSSCGFQLPSGDSRLCKYVFASRTSSLERAFRVGACTGFDVFLLHLLREGRPNSRFGSEPPYSDDDSVFLLLLSMWTSDGALFNVGCFVRNARKPIVPSAFGHSAEFFSPLFFIIFSFFFFLFFSFFYLFFFLSFFFFLFSFFLFSFFFFCVKKRIEVTKQDEDCGDSAWMLFP